MHQKITILPSQTIQDINGKITHREAQHDTFFQDVIQTEHGQYSHHYCMEFVQWAVVYPCAEWIRVVVVVVVVGCSWAVVVAC